jgi:hypothetical protein
MNKRIKVIQENTTAIIAKEEASVIKLNKVKSTNHNFCDLQIGGQVFTIGFSLTDKSRAEKVDTAYSQLADCLKAVEKFVYNDTTPHGVLVVDLTEQRETVANPYAIVKIHRQHDGDTKEPKGAGDFIKHVASSVTDVYSVRVDLADGVAIGEVNDAVLEDTALEMLMEALDMTSADLPVDDIYVDERHEGTYKTTYASWRYED